MWYLGKIQKSGLESEALGKLGDLTPGLLYHLCSRLFQMKRDRLFVSIALNTIWILSIKDGIQIFHKNYQVLLKRGCQSL